LSRSPGNGRRLYFLQGKIDLDFEHLGSGEGANIFHPGVSRNFFEMGLYDLHGLGNESKPHVVLMIPPVVMGHTGMGVYGPYELAKPVLWHPGGA
jgi:hypothetical protein